MGGMDIGCQDISNVTKGDAGNVFSFITGKKADIDDGVYQIRDADPY